jgi:hypothetical protein
MKLENKIILVIIACAIAALTIFSLHTQESSLSSAVSAYDVFGGDGTNSSTTVNTTSTQVLDGLWSTYARITNTAANLVTCFMDNKTAASSTVTANTGIMLFASSSARSQLCFGKGPDCIPYVGKVNCLANATGVVATFEK